MKTSLHQDALVVDSLMVCCWSPEILEQIRASGLTAINATCAVWENFRETMENIARWQRWFADHGDLVVPVRHSAELRAAREAGKLGIILGFQNGSPFEDRVDFVRLFKALGVGVVQLTYNNQNLIGSGCYETTDSGLSDFGRMVIDEMNAAGIAVDLSHVGPKTSADAIAHSKRPVCFSHANPRALKEHVRNKDDGLLRTLVDKGGYVGVNLIPAFMPDHANRSVDDVVVMLDYLIDLVGEDHLGIGTDLTDGHGPDFWHWITHVNGQGPAVIQAGDPIAALARIDNYPMITAALEKHGYGEARIRKILGLNFTRYLADAWNE